ncbi:MAG: hypothetical protein AABW79_00305 [Nanoarchaeota archaeon]
MVLSLAETIKRDIEPDEFLDVLKSIESLGKVDSMERGDFFNYLGLVRPRTTNYIISDTPVGKCIVSANIESFIPRRDGTSEFCLEIFIYDDKKVEAKEML